MADASTTITETPQRQNVAFADLLSDVRAFLAKSPPDNQAAIAAIDRMTQQLAARDTEVEAKRPGEEQAPA